MVIVPKPIRTVLAALALAPGIAVAQQSQLNEIGDAARLPSNPRLLELLNDTTLGELGFCGAANYESHANVLAPSFIRNNAAIQQVHAASRVVEQLPESTRSYLERESGFSSADIATFNVNYAGTEPGPTDRLVLDLGVHARPHGTVTEHDGVRRNRYASETARLEIEGHHARAIADTLDAVCADTRFGELRSITGDQYLNVLRAAAHGFESLYGEKSGLHDEIRRLEASLEARIATDPPARDVPVSGPDEYDAPVDRAVPEPAPSEDRPEAPLVDVQEPEDYAAVPPAEPRTPDVAYEHRRDERAPASVEVPLRTVPVDEPDAVSAPPEPSLEDRIGLEIAYFEPGVRKEFETFAGSYTAALSADGSRLMIEGDGARSEIAIDGNVRLAYTVDPMDGLDNAHRAHIYANPQGWRYNILAVTQDPTIIAYREGPHDATETFTTADLWTTAALPHSFEGYTSATGWERIVDGYALVNVANVTGEIGRSITLRTED